MISSINNKKYEYRIIKIKNTVRGDTFTIGGLNNPCPDRIIIKKIIIFEVGVNLNINSLSCDLFGDLFFYGCNSIGGLVYTQDYDLIYSNNKRNIEGCHNYMISPCNIDANINAINGFLFLQFETDL